MSVLLSRLVPSPARRSVWTVTILLLFSLVLLIMGIRQYHQSSRKPLLRSPKGEWWYRKPPQHAYATLLSDESGGSPNDDDDNYFVATRILAYQLLVAETTKTTHKYPFIVLVTPGVAQSKRRRLELDGAVVWEPEPVEPGWIANPEVSTWRSVLAKLRVWELTQFERICFIDADTILTRSLDLVFEDPAVAIRQNQGRLEAIRDDERLQPSEYVFAGVPEPTPEHRSPPTENGTDFYDVDYFNAGFFVIKPDLELLHYYLHFRSLEGRFEPGLPEQNLLNYAHRRTGNMPWTRLNITWNIHYPSLEDWRGGVVTLHEKWWAPVSHHLNDLLLSWRWRMEGYQQCRAAGHQDRDK